MVNAMGMNAMEVFGAKFANVAEPSTTEAYSISRYCLNLNGLLQPWCPTTQEHEIRLVDIEAQTNRSWVRFKT